MICLQALFEYQEIPGAAEAAVNDYMEIEREVQILKAACTCCLFA